MEPTEDIFADLLSGLQPQTTPRPAPQPEYVSMEDSRRNATSDGEPEAVPVRRSDSPVGENLRPPPPPLTKKDVEHIVKDNVRELLFQSFGALTHTLRVALGGMSEKIATLEVKHQEVHELMSKAAENQTRDSEAFTESFRHLDVALKEASVGIQRVLEKQDLVDAHVLLNRHAREEQEEKKKAIEEEKNEKRVTAQRPKEQVMEEDESTDSDEEDPPRPVVLPKKKPQAKARPTVYAQGPEVVRRPVEQEAERRVEEVPYARNDEEPKQPTSLYAQPPAVQTEAQMRMPLPATQQPNPVINTTAQQQPPPPQMVYHGSASSPPVMNQPPQQALPPQQTPLPQQPVIQPLQAPPPQQPGIPPPQQQGIPPPQLYPSFSPHPTMGNAYKPSPPTYSYPSINHGGGTGYNSGAAPVMDKPPPPGYPSQPMTSSAIGTQFGASPMPPLPPTQPPSPYQGYPSLARPQLYRPVQPPPPPQQPAYGSASTMQQPTNRPPVPAQRPPETGRASSQTIPLEQVISDVANMGFDRTKVRSVVTSMLDHGESVDLNVVIDRLDSMG